MYIHMLLCNVRRKLFVQITNVVKKGDKLDFIYDGQKSIKYINMSILHTFVHHIHIILIKNNNLENLCK